jgi:hypothetical protein
MLFIRRFSKRAEACPATSGRALIAKSLRAKFAVRCDELVVLGAGCIDADPRSGGGFFWPTNMWCQKDLLLVPCGLRRVQGKVSGRLISSQVYELKGYLLDSWRRESGWHVFWKALSATQPGE